MKKVVYLLLGLSFLFAVCGCSTAADPVGGTEVSTTTSTVAKGSEAGKSTTSGSLPSQTTGSASAASTETKETVSSTASGQATSSVPSRSRSTESTQTSSTTTGCAHRNTEIRGRVEPSTTASGYTGDTYCRACGTRLSVGATIPKLSDESSGKVTYSSNGFTYVVDADVDITAYTMALRTQQISSAYREIELEILRLCNEERAKEGVAPLAWYEDAYYFTEIRAEEARELFEHMRPNGSAWHTVYTDAGVILRGTWGENLFYSIGLSAEEVAQIAVENWMKSPGHRANILNANYKKLAIAVYEDSEDGSPYLSIVQNFFG